MGDAVGGGNIDADGGPGRKPATASPCCRCTTYRRALVKLLDGFRVKPGMVRVDPGRNMLLIQGTGPERRTAVETVLSFDVDWMRGQSVGYFPVHNSTPEPIIAELEKIMDSGEGGLSQKHDQVPADGADERHSRRHRKPDLLRAAETWIKRLDKSDTRRRH